MTDNLRGALWMFGMVASLSLLAIAARELAPRHNPMELQVVRHGMSLLILAPFVIRAGLRSFQTTNLKLQLFRNVSHFAATIGWYTAVTLLPLAEVFAIEFTTPVWVAVLAVLFLGEKMNVGRVVALVLGIAGILVILRPGFNDVGPGTWMMVATAFGFAIANACTKGLTRTDSVLTVLLWMSMLQGLMAVVGASFDWTAPTVDEIPWLIVIGVTGLGAHYSLAKALTLADVSLVNPVDFLRLPLIAVVGFLAYGEGVDVLVLVGAGIIFVGNYYSIRRESR
ncbi:MAG: DMT family transporter [Alphaproteobacteria bacterium]|nr:DMT family transporter [Alphaproteobacteria bacterium]